MKRHFIALLVFLLGFASYQVNAQSQFRYRAQLGAGSSGYIDSSVKNTLGYHAGAQMDWRVSPNSSVFLTTGLMFESKGGGKEEEHGNLKINAYYLHIPMMARIEKNMFRNEDAYKYYAALGPYLGVGLFGKTKWDDYSYVDEDDKEVAVAAGKESTFSKSQLRRFDLGLEANLGVIFYEHLQLELRANMGFLKAFRVGHGMNQTISISVGYIF